jgi:peptide/nickel transport system substrate-binding protein
MLKVVSGYPCVRRNYKMSSKAVTKVQAAIVIVIIVAAVGAGVYLTSSRTSPTSMTGTTSQSVPNADTITVESIGQPDFVDPAIDYETAGAQILQNVYETLVFFQGSTASQVRPWLAQTVDVSSDGLTYTFHLRSGITFSDSTPLDANAVYYSLMRPLIIDDPNSPAWAMDQAIRGGANYSKSYNNAGPSAPNGYGDTYTKAELQDLLNAKPVEVIDPMTVAVHLERPYAGWQLVMAFSVASIVSPTAFKAHWTAPTDPNAAYVDGITAGDYSDTANSWAATNAVGTGPYTLQSWDKASETLVLQANPTYWGGPDHRGVAPTKNVIIKGIEDANTRILDFKAGASDIAYVPTTGGLIFQFVDKTTWFNNYTLKTLSPDFQVYPQCPPAAPFQGKCLFPQFETDFIGLNQRILGADKKPQAFQPFQDIRIRKAVTLLFNRSSYIHDVTQDFAIPATQIIPPGMFGYDSSIQPTPYDPATAQSLLLDAGANPLTPTNAFSPKNPQTIAFSYNLGNTARETAATILANSINSMSAKTGLFATVTGLAWPQFLGLQRTHQITAFFVGWVVDYVDPDDFIQPFVNTYFNLQIHYVDAQAQALANQQAMTTDPVQRAQLISQLQNLVNNDYAYIWRSNSGVFGISRSWIHERANASVASGMYTANPAIYGYYFSEMTKGSMTGGILQPSFFATIQTGTSALVLPKSLF